MSGGASRSGQAAASVQQQEHQLQEPLGQAGNVGSAVVTNVLVKPMPIGTLTERPPAAKVEQPVDTKAAGFFRKVAKKAQKGAATALNGL